jgi:hypothetical protein
MIEVNKEAETVSEEVTEEVTEQQVDETPTEEPSGQSFEGNPDQEKINEEVYNQMIPLFKKLNMTDEQARAALDRINSKDGQGLSAEDGLIFGKYKDSVAATEAFKKLESENGRLRREKSPKAPDAYEFNFKDDPDVSDIYGEDFDFNSDPMYQAMDPIFKDANLSQEQADKIVKGFGLIQKSQRVDVDAEIEKLGAEGPKVIAEVEQFVQKNYSAKDQDILASIATSAEGIQFIKNNLMKSKTMPGENINTTTESSSDLFVKAQEIRKSSNFEYDTNAIARYEKIMDEAVKLQGRGL